MMSLWASKASMAIASRDGRSRCSRGARSDWCRVSAQGLGLGLAGPNVGSEGERG
jgi:hypothetical protein